MSRVAAGTVDDPRARTGHEVDVVAYGRDEKDREMLLAIGEVKWNETMGIGHLRRLKHILGLLQARDGVRTENSRLICFSGAGFTGELRSLADKDPGLQLVDLERLYEEGV